ncbi:MAG: signal peptidase II [Candidatus Eisenbacteria bacterium]
MKRSFPLLIGVAAVLVAVDQWTKHWATAHLAFAPSRHVIGDLVQLTYTRNSGIAFGLLADLHAPLWAFSALASVIVLVLFARHPVLSLGRQLSLAFILGGAIGNLIDRAATGEVVDFIYLQWNGHGFPVFNVADICVNVGVALFALAWTRDTEDPAPATEAATVPEGAAHEAGGADGSAAGSGPAGGPLAGEGADRPLT